MIRIGDHHRIGAVIADLRALNRLTQRQLGALVGVAQGQISDWERGEKIPTTAILSRIAQGLGYELALMPVDETDPETALSVSLADQGAETHTRVGVSDSSGAEARSGGRE